MDQVLPAVRAAVAAIAERRREMNLAPPQEDGADEALTKTTARRGHFTTAGVVLFFHLWICHPGFSPIPRYSAADAEACSSANLFVCFDNTIFQSLMAI